MGTIPLEELSFPEDKRTRRSGTTSAASSTGTDGTATVHRPRQPRSVPTLKAVDKETIKRTYKLAGEAAKMIGKPEFAIDDKEADELADAMYEVAKEYPTFAEYVVKGRKASVWGNMLLVHLFIFSRKADAYAKNHPSKPKQPAPNARPTVFTAPRPTLLVRGDERERQDDTGAEASVSP